MSKKEFSWTLFSKAPIIGIVRNLAFDEVKKILPIYYEAGLTNVEITMNTHGAEKIINYATENYSSKLNVGAGTVCTLSDLDKAIAAGAQFIVTPITKKKVIRTCVKKNVPIFPGALSPSEIYKAWSLGASMVKIFPATSFGPEYIKDLKGPLNQIKLLPTGGVDLNNMSTFLNYGADGLGIGGQLFDKTLISADNMEGLKEHFAEFVKRLNN